MTIVVHPPPDGPTGGRRPAVAMGTIGPHARSKDLLPSIRARTSAPAPAGRARLAPDALRSLRLLERVEAAGGRLDAAFVRAVATVLRQLDPLLTRRSLAASFDRESFHRAGGPIAATARPDVPAPVAVMARPDPVRLAYALRWLELGMDGEGSLPLAARFRIGRGRNRRCLAGPRHRPPIVRRRPR